MNFILIFFIVISIVLTANNEIVLISNLTVEGAFIETLQAFLILASIGLIFIFRKNLQRVYSKNSIYLKFLILSFLLYEEISYLTTNRFLTITNKYNTLPELNVHNANIFHDFLGDSIPLFNTNFVTDGLNLINLFTVIILIALGYGQYFSFLFKKFKFLFFEKKYAIYSLIFVFNYLISIFIRKFQILNGDIFLDPEYIETILYFIVLVDNYEKINLSKNFKL